MFARRTDRSRSRSSTVCRSKPAVMRCCTGSAQCRSNPGNMSYIMQIAWLPPGNLSCRSCRSDRRDQICRERSAVDHLQVEIDDLAEVWTCCHFMLLLGTKYGDLKSSKCSLTNLREERAHSNSSAGIMYTVRRTISSRCTSNTSPDKYPGSPWAESSLYFDSFSPYTRIKYNQVPKG